MTEPLRLSFARAGPEHVSALAMVRSAAGRGLAERYGPGYWASEPSERAVLTSLRDAHVLVARRGSAIVATCRLSKKRPWAIDPSFFTQTERPLYLTDMAVRPDYQGRGVGRALLQEAARYARLLGADALRLDAYDAPAGAGEFYASCGWTERGRVDYRGVPLLYYELLL